MGFGGPSFRWVSDSADAQIDALVYELYGLTEEGIGIVMGDESR